MSLRNSGSSGREAERENDIPGRENSKSKAMASQKFIAYLGDVRIIWYVATGEGTLEK